MLNYQEQLARSVSKFPRLIYKIILLREIHMKTKMNGLIQSVREVHIIFQERQVWEVKGKSVLQTTPSITLMIIKVRIRTSNLTRWYNSRLIYLKIRLVDSLTAIFMQATVTQLVSVKQNHPTKCSIFQVRKLSKELMLIKAQIAESQL